MSEVSHLVRDLLFLLKFELIFVLAVREVLRKVQPLDWKEPLEKEMATHSRILAWESPWTEQPSGLQVHGVAKSSI